MQQIFSLLFIFSFIGVVKVQEPVIEQGAEQNSDEIDVETYRKLEIQNERDNLQTLLKTLHYSCIVLARVQLSSYENYLIDLLKSYSDSDQKLLWKKLYSSHVYKCQHTITYEESVQVFSKIKSNEFELEKYEHVFANQTLDQFQNLSRNNLVLTEEEVKIWKYVEEFEQTLDERKRQKEEEEINLQSQDSKYIQYEIEPKIFGFSLEIPPSIQLIILLAFFILLGFVFKIIFTKLTTENPKKKNQIKIKKLSEEKYQQIYYQLQFPLWFEFESQSYLIQIINSKIKFLI